MAENKFVFQSFDKKESKKTEQEAAEKRKTAVALAYDPSSDEAPRVIASGKGVLAEKILSVAKEENIPVHQDAPLAKTLSNLEIGENIPPELYEVVAEILLFVDRMDKWKDVMPSQATANQTMANQAAQAPQPKRKGLLGRRQKSNTLQ